jgi:hypothetical protein
MENVAATVNISKKVVFFFAKPLQFQLFGQLSLAFWETKSLLQSCDGNKKFRSDKSFG